jgi:hypothetical protein
MALGVAIPVVNIQEDKLGSTTAVTKIIPVVYSSSINWSRSMVHPIWPDVCLSAAVTARKEQEGLFLSCRPHDA